MAGDGAVSPAMLRASVGIKKCKAPPTGAMAVVGLRKADLFHNSTGKYVGLTDAKCILTSDEPMLDMFKAVWVHCVFMHA